MTKISDVLESFWNRVERAANSVWDAIVDMFKAGAEKAAEVLEAFAKRFASNVDDILVAAATVGYEAASTVEGDWKDKLGAAFEKAVEELGDKAASYAKTDIINAVQAVYVKKTAPVVTKEAE